MCIKFVKFDFAAAQMPEPATAGVASSLEPMQTSARAAAPNTPTGDRASRDKASPLTNIAAARPEFHDFRDRGNPMEKTHPDPRHWSRWHERQDDFDWREP